MGGENKKERTLIFWGFNDPSIFHNLQKAFIINEAPLHREYDFYLCSEDVDEKGKDGKLWGVPVKNLPLSYQLAERWKEDILYPSNPWDDAEKVLQLDVTTAKQLKQIRDYRQVQILADTRNVPSLLALFKWLKQKNERANHSTTLWLYYRNGAGDKDTPATMDEVLRYVLLKRFERLPSLLGKNNIKAMYLIAPQYFVSSPTEELNYCLHTIQCSMRLEPHLIRQPSVTFTTAASALLLRDDENRQKAIAILLQQSFYDHFTLDLEATVADWGWSRMSWKMRPPQFPSLEALEEYLRQNVYKGSGYNQTVEDFVQLGFSALATLKGQITADTFTLFVEERGDEFFKAFQRQISPQWEEFLASKVQELRLRADLAQKENKIIFTHFITLLEHLILIVRQISGRYDAEAEMPADDLLIQLILNQNRRKEKPVEYWRQFLQQTVMAFEKADEFSAEIEQQARAFSHIPLEKMIQFKALSELAIKYSVDEKQIFELASKGALLSTGQEEVNSYYRSLLQQFLFRELREVERRADVKAVLLQSKNQQAFYCSSLSYPIPQDLFADYLPLELPLQTYLLLLYNQISELHLIDFVFGEKLQLRTQLALNNLREKDNLSFDLLNLLPDARQAFLEKLMSAVYVLARKINENQWKVAEGTIIKKKQAVRIIKALENELKRLTKMKSLQLPVSLAKSERILVVEILDYLQGQSDAPALSEFLKVSQPQAYATVLFGTERTQKVKAHL